MIDKDERCIFGSERLVSMDWIVHGFLPLHAWLNLAFSGSIRLELDFTLRYVLYYAKTHNGVSIVFTIRSVKLST